MSYKANYYDFMYIQRVIPVMWLQSELFLLPANFSGEDTV